MELSSPITIDEPKVWTLSIYGDSNPKEIRAGIVLEGTNGILVAQLLHFQFKVSNNTVEYEVVVAELKATVATVERSWHTK
jgi:hypothetical protein